MRIALGTLVGMVFASCLGAQTIFPPASLATATSVEGAMSALGVTRPEVSGHLLLDLPDVAPAGTIRGSVSSEIPGTSQVIILRGAPAALTIGGQAPRSTAPGTPALQSTAGQPNPVVLVAAERIAPGAAARLALQIDVSTTQWFTLLSFAQGRWFIATREVKIGRASGGPVRAPKPAAVKARTG